MTRYAVLAVFLLLLSACESGPPERPLMEKLMAQPVPASDTERDAECALLRQEIVRQQSLGQAAPTMASSPMWAAAFQMQAAQNAAAYQARYSQIQCDVIRVAPEENVTARFDQCFAKCREVTSRTEEQCFDACKP